MTRLTKPIILETPCCNAKVLKRRFASLNSFGLATKWSDGYSRAFMLADAPRLGYCSSCNKTYWLEDANELGVFELPNNGEVSKRRWLARFFGNKKTEGRASQLDTMGSLFLDRVDYHEHPRPADLLLSVLREEWATPAREEYLRTWLWWAGNHGQRKRRTASPMSAEQSCENMEQLLLLLQATPECNRDWETYGELLRQLGRFDEAVAVLDGRSESSAKAAAIQAAAKRRDSRIFELIGF